jgi:ABC-2 type transport system ATP-binding protein
MVTETPVVDDASGRPRPAVLIARGLRKRYGTIEAVRDVSFTIHEGETYGLLGPNGAGKTTTISMICGLLERDAGEITLDGAPVDMGAVAAKAGIGFVPQDLAIYPDLSARENLEFFGRLYGLSGARLRERTAEVLDLIGLGERAKDRTSTFSGGMQRRLNIGIGLLHQPRLLLLDEPTVGVDPQSRNAILESIAALGRKGMAILYTTHYMEEAERLCDRIVIVDHGKVVASDTLSGIERLLPATQVLEIEVDGLADLVALRALPGIDGVTQEGGLLRAGVADLGRSAPALLAALAASGRRVSRVASARPGLEDVFLSLTGRQLRD